jgi:ATP-dependent protease ClpP protease subunit
MFTVDYNSDEPIMLLNKQIGQSFNEDESWDGIPFIDGAQFQEELMYLDTLGKKRIQVWINSPGGSIMQAMNIFSAILKSKTPVDTYNVGVCASSGGLVFMAGRKRIMSDYAQFMTHPPVGADDKTYEAFKESCVTMLSAKSDITPELMTYLMDVTTWLGSSECLAKGICNEIEVTKDINKKRMPSTDVKAMLAFSNNILNDFLSNNKTTEIMVFSKITNKLKLVEGSTEDVILSAINKLEADKIVAEATAKEANEKVTEAENKVTELQSKLDVATAELDVAKKATETAEETAKETVATDMVNQFKEKIGNKPETLTKWVNMAKADLEGTKEMLEAIPLNKVGNKIETTSSGNAKRTVGSIMATINNRINGKQ